MCLDGIGRNSDLKCVINLAKSFDFMNLNFHRWPIYKNFVDGMLKKVPDIYFHGKNQKPQNREMFRSQKVSSSKVDCVHEKVWLENIMGSSSFETVFKSWGYSENNGS